MRPAFFTPENVEPDHEIGDTEDASMRPAFFAREKCTIGISPVQSACTAVPNGRQVLVEPQGHARVADKRRSRSAANCSTADAPLTIAAPQRAAPAGLPSTPTDR